MAGWRRPAQRVSDGVVAYWRGSSSAAIDRSSAASAPRRDGRRRRPLPAPRLLRPALLLLRLQPPPQLRSSVRQRRPRPLPPPVGRPLLLRLQAPAGPAPTRRRGGAPAGGAPSGWRLPPSLSALRCAIQFTRLGILGISGWGFGDSLD